MILQLEMLTARKWAKLQSCGTKYARSSEIFYKF